MIRLDQVKTDGNDEGQAKSTGESIGFGAFENRAINRVKFDSDSGTLMFVRQSGDLVQVGGLPTLASFGRGKDGVRGKRGAPGRPGRPGRDGKTGETGCPGKTGERGITGIKGQRGIDGERGYQGETGYQGQPGPTGDPGPTGYRGVIGPAGNVGVSCIAGATGATGNKPNERALWSDTVPQAPEDQIWAFPTDSNNPQPLPGQQDLLIAMAPVYVTAERDGDSDFFEAEGRPVVKVRGGKEPYSYSWRITEIAEVDEESITLTQTGSDTGSFRFYDHVPMSQNRELWIRVSVTVTDAAGASQTVGTRITYVAFNSDNRACFLFGQRVRTQAGLIPVEQLKTGDLIECRTGMPKDTDNWSATDIGGMNSWAAVKRANHGTEDMYIRINNMRVTPEHPIFFKRDGRWIVRAAREIVDGDLVWTKAGEMRAQVTTAAEQVNTVDIAVDVFHCYYVEDILVHNPDARSEEEKGQSWR